MVAAMLPLTLALLPGPFSAPGVLRSATAPGVLRAAPAPALMSLRGASAAKAAKASSGAKVKQVLSTKRWWRPSQDEPKDVETKSRWSLPGRKMATPTQEETAATQPAVRSMPALDISSMTLPDVSLPSMPAISLPSFGKEAAVNSGTEFSEAPLPEPEPEPELQQSSPVPPVVANLGSMLVRVASTLIVLATAKVQLAAVRQYRRTRASLDDTASDLAAAPARILAAAQQAVRMAPFYAKAAVQIAYEDSVKNMEAFKVESQRRVVSAPQEARAASRLAFENARAAAASALNELAKAPDRLVEGVAAKVKDELQDAKAQVDAKLTAAQSKIDSVSKRT